MISVSARTVRRRPSRNQDYFISMAVRASIERRFISTGASGAVNENMSNNVTIKSISFMKGLNFRL